MTYGRPPGARGTIAPIVDHATLTVREHERVHAALAEIGRARTPESFADVACRELLELIPGVTSAYLEINPLEQRTAARQWPDPGARWYGRFGPVANRLQHAFPHYGRMVGGMPRTGSWTFADDDPFVRTELFHEFFRPNGVSSQLAFTLPAPPTTAIALTVNRDGTPFTDREHRLADAVRIHLGNLRELVARNDDPPAVDGWACLTVSDGGTVLRTTPAAVELGERLGAELQVGGSLAGHDLWVSLGLPARAGRWQVHTETRSVYVRAGATYAVRVLASAVGPHVLWIHAPTLLRRDAVLALGLTPRQYDVAQLLVDGIATDEIARRLYVSRATVRKHVERILATLGVRSRLEAVVTLIRASQ